MTCPRSHSQQRGGHWCDSQTVPSSWIFCLLLGFNPKALTLSYSSCSFVVIFIHFETWSLPQPPTVPGLQTCILLPSSACVLRRQGEGAGRDGGVNAMARVSAGLVVCEKGTEQECGMIFVHLAARFPGKPANLRLHHSSERPGLSSLTPGQIEPISSPNSTSLLPKSIEGGETQRTQG